MGKSRTAPAPEIRTGQLLGGLSPESFLRDYWQKRPLLVRQAFPQFAPPSKNPLGPDGLMELAMQEDAESRLVRQSRGRWALEHGPFTAERLAALPRRNWSLLVSGVNLMLPFGDRLLRAFGFMPHARLDDLMVSYAPEGGGVGPHFDSYDVFLIQGHGRRRWEISSQTDLELVADAPLRILQRFQAEKSWDLEPGDLLYLPPKYAHNGVALSPCMTWSVGFRAPSRNELAGAFLAYLQDHLDLPGIYGDADLSLPRHPAELTPELLRRMSEMIQGVHWTRQDEAAFLGTYLSEPKPHVYFEPPDRPMGLERFARQAADRGVRLDPRSRMLYIRGGAFFINGESFRAPSGCRRILVQLADRRALPGSEWPAALMTLFHEWYRAGYLWPAAEI